MSYFCTSVSYLLVLYAITLLASNISLHKRFQTFPKLSLNISERLDVQLFSEALDNPRCSEMLRNSVKHDREKWMFKKMLVTIQTSTLKCICSVGGMNTSVPHPFKTVTACVSLNMSLITCLTKNFHKKFRY